MQLLHAIGGGPTGRGGGKTLHAGRAGLGGRRPDPGLLVPDASRQEAEANSTVLNPKGTQRRPLFPVFRALRFPYKPPSRFWSTVFNTFFWFWVPIIATYT